MIVGPQASFLLIWPYWFPFAYSILHSLRLFYSHNQGEQTIEAVARWCEEKGNCTISKLYSIILILFVHGGWLSDLLVSSVGGDFFGVLDVHIHSPLFSTPCLVNYVYHFAYHPLSDVYYTQYHTTIEDVLYSVMYRGYVFC